MEITAKILFIKNYILMEKFIKRKKKEKRNEITLKKLKVHFSLQFLNFLKQKLSQSHFSFKCTQ